MGKSVRNKLESEIKVRLNELQTMQLTDQNYGECVARVEKLYKLYQANMDLGLRSSKDASEMQEKTLRFGLEKEKFEFEKEKHAYEKKRAKEDDEARRKERRWNGFLGVAEILIPPIVSIGLFNKGLEFEKDGTVSSGFFGNFLRGLKFWGKRK